MQAPTKSESLLERFCAYHDLPLFKCVYPDTPKPGTRNETADYVVVLRGHAVVIEVKEIEPNPEEQRYVREFMHNDSAGFLPTVPGSRVRKMIEDARPQLKRTSSGILPTLLVLFDNSSIPLSRLEPYEILTGMYGVEQVVIGVPKGVNNAPFVANHKHGPNQGVSRTQNTTLSSVSTLSQSNQAVLRLDIYHNDYATNKIDPEWLRIDGCRHWKRAPSGRDTSFREWIEI